MNGQMRFIAILLMLLGLAAGSAAGPCPVPGVSRPTGVTGGDQGPATIAWEPVGDAMYYQIWVSKGGTLFHKEWFEGETEWTSDGPLPAGDYSVHVRTWNPCGFGNWSTAYLFSIDCSPDAGPWPLSPNGETYEVEFDGVLRWSRSMPQATWYNIRIEKDGLPYRDAWRSYACG